MTNMLIILNPSSR